MPIDPEPQSREFEMTIEAARKIVSNPTRQQSPFLRRLAWIALKHDQGRRVVQSRLPHADRPFPPGAA